MKSKTIVITGATGVLGNLVAKTFAERGHNIALLDRDQAKLDSLIRDPESARRATLHPGH